MKGIHIRHEIDNFLGVIKSNQLKNFKYTYLYFNC